MFLPGTRQALSPNQTHNIKLSNAGPGPPYHYPSYLLFCMSLADTKSNTKTMRVLDKLLFSGSLLRNFRQQLRNFAKLAAYITLTAVLVLVRMTSFSPSYLHSHHCQIYCSYKAYREQLPLAFQRYFHSEAWRHDRIGAAQARHDNIRAPWVKMLVRHF